MSTEGPAKLSPDMLGGGIGKLIGISDWFAVDQAQISAFAETTGDTYWLHTDPERAAADPRFGGTIAHGFLLLSLTARFGFETWLQNDLIAESMNYGVDRVRFTAIVPCDARIRGVFHLSSASLRPDGGYLIGAKVVIEIENAARPAMVAETLTLVRFKQK